MRGWVAYFVRVSYEVEDNFLPEIDTENLESASNLLSSIANVHTRDKLDDRRRDLPRNLRCSRSCPARLLPGTVILDQQSQQPA